MVNPHLDQEFTYKPKKANVAPIHPGQDDRRSAYLRNQAIQNANAARQHKATFGDVNWIMSQSPETMLDRDFMSKAKPAMVAMQGNRDFLTTDKDETRNLYQMWINQMKGGDKGARMLDTRGLPAGARRIGRTLFQDPSKSQGFFGDMRTMVGDIIPGMSRKPNPAAVRATEYNPFPKAGFGKEFYKDEFPFASSFGNLMGLVDKSPTLSMIASLFPKKERIPLEQDLSWVPENVGAYNEIPEIPFMGEFEEEVDLSPGTDWYGPYNEDWEKLQAYLRGDMERDADIESIYFDSQPGIVEEFDEDAINALKDQIMSNPNTTTFGDASKLYDIDANFFDPEAFIEEQMELGNEPNIETGIIDFEPSPVMEENNIIQDAVEKNPWILRIMGNDYKYIRGWLWDLGVLNPKSDMYKKTDQLEQPE